MEGRDLFTNIEDEQGHYNVHAHLAQMIALLGLPPKALLQREGKFRKLTFAPDIQNPEGQPCSNACQYFGGPFFDDHGKIDMQPILPESFYLLTTLARQESSFART